MLRRSAIPKMLMAAASLAACVVLCSCSAVQSSIDSDDLVASYVRGGGETTTTTNINEDSKGFGIEVVSPDEIDNVASLGERVRFEDVDNDVVSASCPPVESAQSNDATVEEEEQSGYCLESSSCNESGAAGEDALSEPAASAPSSTVREVTQSEKPKSSSSSENKRVSADQSSPASSPSGTSSAPPSASTTSSSAKQITSVSTKPTSSSTASSQVSMTEEERLAREIFDEYNAFRASKGLNRVAWSGYCASMATSSASGCAARSDLVHRLGIPADKQGSYSDVLQYASWQLSASEAMDNWVDSTGHRKQLQCETATQAGVGVVKASDGRWYVALVYDFSGCNVGGN